MNYEFFEAIAEKSEYINKNSTISQAEKVRVVQLCILYNFLGGNVFLTVRLKCRNSYGSFFYPVKCTFTISFLFRLHAFGSVA
jgi:hypothetical protein